MPFVPVTCASGSHEFWYSFSTPEATTTDKPKPDLPIILFIHSSWTASEVFHSQFADRELRQFNLLAVDLLAHGATKGRVPDSVYTPKETADDLIQVLDALNLPQVHVFGLALGGTVGLQLAAHYPERVLSLTICSPLTPTDPEEVTEGRAQVFGYWSEVFEDFDWSMKDEEEVEQKNEMVNEIILGATELLYGYDKHTIEKMTYYVSGLKCIITYSGSPENLAHGHFTSLRWYTDRVPLTPEELAQIKCPVSIIYCTEDVGYTLENAEALEERLQAAGVRATLHQVPGPHYGVVANADRIDPILRDTVLSVSNTPVTLPKPDYESGLMHTPWTDVLKRFGYSTDGEHKEYVIENWFTLPRDIMPN